MSIHHMRRFTSRVLIVTALAAQTASGQTAGQAPAAKAVMQQKLARSQAILGAVVTSDWTTLARESRALLALTRDPAFTALVTPDTRPRTEPFAQALQDLIDAADKHDLNDAAMAQVTMNLHCVRCHQLMARIAQRSPARF